MISRQSIRTTLAAILRSQVPSAQVVYDHEPGDLGGASPVIVISASSSQRPRLTFQGNQSAMYFSVDVYTTAATSEDGTYTYADSADVIDAVEAQIAECVSRNQENGTWSTIAYDGRTTITFALFDGIPSFRERIPLVITFLG